LRPRRAAASWSLAPSIAVALDVDDVAVMGDPIDESDDAGGVGENGRPFLEGEIGGDDDRAALVVARVDHAVEQIGGVVVIGQIRELVHKSRRTPPP